MPRLRKPMVGAEQPGPEFRHRWLVALAEAETTEAAWARARGLTQTHVRLVSLERSSPLLYEMSAFVREWERKLAERLTHVAAA